MKHGDQGKGKTAKAASQASATRGKTVPVSQGGKAGKAVKTSSSKAGEDGGGQNGKGSGSKKAGSASSKAAPEKGSRLPVQQAAAATPVKKGGSDAGAKGRPVEEPGGFNNPLVANAFKRAVAKYPNAFRKLTD
ncbi:MAG TPA: hypothetical protein VGF48_20255 [Thermoanaerobaculia bacterium]|jgi:hypothetical protein